MSIWISISVCASLDADCVHRIHRKSDPRFSSSSRVDDRVRMNCRMSLSKKWLLSVALVALCVLSLFSLSSAFVRELGGRRIVAPFHSPRHTKQTSSTLFSSPPLAKTRSSRNRRRSKRKRGDERKKGPGRSISQDELTDHVTRRYMEKGVTYDNAPLRSDASDAQQEQSHLKELNSRPALVLNADFQPLSHLPLSLWSWQDAVKAIFSGKVQVVDVYPDMTIRAANLEVALPSVIALTDYVPRIKQRPAFTRRNVFLRDEYKCQYCNDRFHTADLSLDHVKPRCMGGRLTWENAVTCCLNCNGRKGSLPVSKLRGVGMRLVREPCCPNQMELAAKAARMVPRRVHPTWKPYLGIEQRPPTTWSKSGDEDCIDDRYFENEV